VTTPRQYAMCELMGNAPRTMSRHWYHQMRRQIFRFKMFGRPRFTFGPDWYMWERG
jgi:hypothetical protein